MNEGETLSNREKTKDNYKAKYEKLLQEYVEKDARIKELEHENKRLMFGLMRLRDTITDIVDKKWQEAYVPVIKGALMENLFEDCMAARCTIKS